MDLVQRALSDEQGKSNLHMKRICDIMQPWASNDEIASEEHTNGDFDCLAPKLRHTSGTPNDLGMKYKQFAISQVLLPAMKSGPAGDSKVLTVCDGLEQHLGTIGDIDEAFGDHIQDISNVCCCLTTLLEEAPNYTKEADASMQALLSAGVNARGPLGQVSAELGANQFYIGKVAEYKQYSGPTMRHMPLIRRMMQELPGKVDSPAALQDAIVEYKAMSRILRKGSCDELLGKLKASVMQCFELIDQDGNSRASMAEVYEELYSTAKSVWELPPRMEDMRAKLRGLVSHQTDANTIQALEEKVRNFDFAGWAAGKNNHMELLSAAVNKAAGLTLSETTRESMNTFLDELLTVVGQTGQADPATMMDALGTALALCDMVHPAKANTPPRGDLRGNIVCLDEMLKVHGEMLQTTSKHDTVASRVQADLRMENLKFLKDWSVEIRWRQQAGHLNMKATEDFGAFLLDNLSAELEARQLAHRQDLETAAEALAKILQDIGKGAPHGKSWQEGFDGDDILAHAKETLLKANGQKLASTVDALQDCWNRWGVWCGLFSVKSEDSKIMVSSREILTVAKVTYHEASFAMALIDASGNPLKLRNLVRTRKTSMLKDKIPEERLQGDLWQLVLKAENAPFTKVTKANE